MFLDPYSYFGAVYLADRPEAARMELPPEVSECRRSIQRELGNAEGKVGDDEQT
jgi:hypothetical protein